MAQSTKEGWLIFVDTNIMLDFYRMPGESVDRQMKSLKRHLNSIIVTEQVRMEFLKNRAKVITESMSQMAAPQKLTLPMVLTGSRAGKSLTKAMEHAAERHKEAKRRVELILTDPASYDPVYRGLRGIFAHNGPLNLKRPDELRYKIRDMATTRFSLGYPPRKGGDTSIGDALNWEWLIWCAQSADNNHVLIVSRDTDYGVTQGNAVILNDWLRAEFKARVPARKIELTNKLSVALRRLNELVPPEDEAAETSVLEAPNVNRNYVNYLDDPNALRRAIMESNLLEAFEANRLLRKQFTRQLSRLAGEEDMGGPGE